MFGLFDNDRQPNQSRDAFRFGFAIKHYWELAEEKRRQLWCESENIPQKTDKAILEQFCFPTSYIDPTTREEVQVDVNMQLNFLRFDMNVYLARYKYGKPGQYNRLTAEEKDEVINAIIVRFPRGLGHMINYDIENIRKLIAPNQLEPITLDTSWRTLNLSL